MYTQDNIQTHYVKNERNLHLKICLDTVDKILKGTLFHKKTVYKERIMKRIYS